MKAILSVIILFTSFNSLQAANYQEQESFAVVINQHIKSGLNPRLGKSVYLSTNRVNINLTKLDHVDAYIAEIQLIERICSVRECLSVREEELLSYTAILVADKSNASATLLSTVDSPYKYEKEKANIDVFLYLNKSGRVEFTMTLTENNKSTVLVEGKGRL